MTHNTGSFIVLFYEFGFESWPMDDLFHAVPYGHSVNLIFHIYLINFVLNAVNATPIADKILLHSSKAFAPLLQGTLAGETKRV